MRSKDRGRLTKTHPAIDEICLLTERAVRAVVQTIGPTKNSCLMAVNQALSYLFLNNWLQPFECTSHATALKDMLSSDSASEQPGLM